MADIKTARDLASNDPRILDDMLRERETLRDSRVLNSSPSFDAEEFSSYIRNSANTPSVDFSKELWHNIKGE